MLGLLSPFLFALPLRLTDTVVASLLCFASPNGPSESPFTEPWVRMQLPFTKELYIESDDFMEVPPKDFHRLAPGKEVRLRFSYWIKCHGVRT